jgi:hypothetical protein
MIQAMRTVEKGVRALPFLAAFVTIGLIPATALAADNPPNYAADGGDSIKGRITGLDGKYTVYVREKQGKVETVELHQGTVINPTGIRLQPGYKVAIYGHQAGNTFDANVVNTPYHYIPQTVYEPYYPDYFGGFGWGGFGWGGFGWGGYPLY